MALGKDASVAATRFSQLPMGRQLGVLVGLAASVAMGVAVVMWAQKPEFRPLYHSLSGTDSIAVVEALQKANIPYKVNNNNGAVLVAGDKVYQARMELAKEGLPHGSGKGFEMLEKSPGLGTSQFIETARYRHALEGELARTITAFKNVHSARVHLAIPKQAAFIRNKKPASASVMVELKPGRILESQEIAAITHLVASSVPGMQPEQVTIVDGQGLLLSQGGGATHMAVADKQLSYIRQLEQSYVKQIDAILAPLLGPNNFKAQVSANMNFTHSESTKESYDSANPTLRSVEEQTESRGGALAEAGGIPGVLSNQPPGEEPEQAAEPEEGAEGEAAAETQQKGPSMARGHVIRNYEIDKTISHTKEQPWRLNRLSVAVAVNNKDQVDPETNELANVARTPEEMTLITNLVKDAIGFDEERGDRVTVVNSSFAKPLPVEPLPEPSMWEQEWFWSLIKQVLSGLFALVIVLGVIRPIMKGLAGRHGGTIDGSGAGMQQAMMAMAPVEEEVEDLNIAPAEYEKKLKAVKKMVGEDPKRVAQVVKSWVAE